MTLFNRKVNMAALIVKEIYDTARETILNPPHFFVATVWCCRKSCGRFIEQYEARHKTTSSVS